MTGDMGDVSPFPGRLRNICAPAAKGLATGSLWLAGVLFLVMTGDILAGVGSRYIFKTVPVWTEELARYTLVWMVMIAANPALYFSDHMAIDLDIFPGRTARGISLVRGALFVGILGFMTWQGSLYAAKMAPFKTMGLGISKAIPLAAVPAGLGLVLVQYLLMLGAGRGRRS